MPVISTRVSDELYQEFKKAIKPYGFEESEAFRYAIYFLVYELKTRPRIIRAATKFMDRIYLGLSGIVDGTMQWIDEHTRIGVGRPDVQQRIIDKDLQEVHRKISARKKTE